MKQNQNLLIVSQISESFDVSSGCRGGGEGRREGMG